MADEVETALGTDEIEEELEVDSTIEGEETNQDDTEGTGKDTEGEEENPDKETETDEEEDESKLDLKSPTWKQVTTKYPQLFKDFPALKHTFWHAQEYRKIFPSVEDAQEALENVEKFEALQSSLTSGNVEDLTATIKSFDEEIIGELGVNFLPALRKASPEAYYEAITPELTNFCRALYDSGARNGNENMKNAAMVAAAHFFNDPKVASGERAVATKEPKKDDRLEQERKEFNNERYTTLLNDVISDSNSKLSSAIESGLDPKGTMTDAMKEMIVERVMKEINKTLNSDRSHTGKMNALWKKAANDGFSSLHKSKIINAYLERAKELMPSVRSKIRSAALGTRTRKTEGDSEGTSRREPNNNTGGGSKGKVNIKQIDATKVDWNKTSDMDILNGRVTYKQ